MVKVRNSTTGDTLTVQTPPAPSAPPAVSVLQGRRIKPADDAVIRPRATGKTRTSNVQHAPKFEATSGSRTPITPQDARRRLGYLQCQMIQSCLKHSGRLMASNFALTEPRFVELLSEVRASESLTMHQFHRITKRQVASLSNTALAGLIEAGAYAMRGIDNGVVSEATLTDMAQERELFGNLVLQGIFSAAVDTLDERMREAHRSARKDAKTEERNASRQRARQRFGQESVMTSSAVSAFGVQLQSIWHQRFTRMRPLIEAVLSNTSMFAGRDALPIALSANLLNDPVRASLHGRALRVLSSDTASLSTLDASMTEWLIPS